MIIKVCGLRVAQNIREVSALDVDWIGLVFWKDSPRFVTQYSSRGGFIPDYTSIDSEVPTLGGKPIFRYQENKPKRVGVFVDDMPQNIVTRVANFKLDFVQLHGEESPVMIQNLRATLEPDIRKGVISTSASPISERWIISSSTTNVHKKVGRARSSTGLCSIVTTLMFPSSSVEVSVPTTWRL